MNAPRKPPTPAFKNSLHPEVTGNRAEMVACTFAPSGCRKSIPRGVAIGLPGIEPRRRIVGTIRRIRIELRLEAQRAILAMNAAIFSGHGPVKKIAPRSSQIGRAHV